MFKDKPSSTTPSDLLYYSHLDSSLEKELKKSLKNKSVKIKKVEDWKTLTAQQVESLHVALVSLNSDNLQKVCDALTWVRQKNRSISVIAITQGLNESQLSYLFNSENFYYFIESIEQVDELIESSFQHFKVRKDYQSSLAKVKQQNRKLEVLNQDLEELVHERTKKEFIANKQMETSVKDTQSILSFVKVISRLENIEDLLLQIGHEFKKVVGLLPPMLIIQRGGGDFTLYFSQGKQISRKRVRKAEVEKQLSEASNESLRDELINVLGRPVGPLSVKGMKFQSTELSQTQCQFVFERSLPNQKTEDYQGFAEERWPIVNMALENILLKENFQDIARQWAKTFNEMDDPIIILDRNYHMTLSNAGYHKQVGKTCYQAFAGLDQPCKDCPVNKTFSEKKAQTSDIHVAGKVYRVHSYPIRIDGDQQVSHVINQYVDITQFIDLQSRVIQGEKMAAVGLLAGNIAHELNNPLTGISSLSELLLDEMDKETTTFKDLFEVKEASKRCQRIIKDLLDFSSVGGDVASGPININELVAKTLPLLKVAMRMLNSDVELYEEPLYVEMNPQLLQQVIFNLVNNACQAMDEGGKLEVQTYAKGKFAYILVRDNGSGIPDEIRDSIFDPFFTTKEEGKGTGLGLSMSRSIVERNGGKLTLNIAYKEGTEFLIEIPLVVK